MRNQPVTNHLSSVPLFADCSKKELAAIARTTDRVDIADGAHLTREGESSREAFVILSGKAVVRRGGRKVAELGEGASVGELGLLDRGPRTATVVADGPVEALVIGSREFSGLLRETPSISRKLMQSLSGTIRSLDSKTYG